MKVEIKIPDGWRKLKNGEALQQGDRYVNLDLRDEWKLLEGDWGSCVEPEDCCMFIRRVK